MTTSTKPSAGTCGGKPGVPGATLTCSVHGLIHPDDWMTTKECLKCKQGPRSNERECYESVVARGSCLGCERCHPADCINCGTADDGLCSAYHGPDCTNCGGTGRDQHGTDDYTPAPPCNTYRRPE